MQKITKGLFSTVPVQSVSGLHPFAQVLYMWLCKYANSENQCRPSIATLCKNTCMAKNSVLKYLDFLESKGFIKKTNRCSKKEFTSNMYDVFIVSPNEQPSSPDELPPSAGNEQPSSPDGNELNTGTKPNFLTKYSKIIPNGITPDGVPFERGSEVENIGTLEIIKEKEKSSAKKEKEKSIVNKQNKSPGLEVYNYLQTFTGTIDGTLEDCIYLYYKLEKLTAIPGTALEKLKTIIEGMIATGQSKYYSISSPSKLTNNLSTIVSKLMSENITQQQNKRPITDLSTK